MRITGVNTPLDDNGRAPTEFGSNAPIIQTKQFNLGTARDLLKIEAVRGTCLWAVDASDLTAWLDVRFNDQLRSPVRYRMGMFVRGTEFSRVYVSNDAQAGKTITLLFATEPNVSKFEIANPAIAYNSVGIANATNYATVDDVALAAGATTIISAANADRRRIHISNFSTNIATLRIGDVNTAAARGTELNPGGTITLETTDAIYGYNPAGIQQNVGVSYTEN